MSWRRTWTALCLAALVAPLGGPARAGVVRMAAAPVPPPARHEAPPELSENPEEFRQQMIDYLLELETALAEAFSHPEIADRLAETLGPDPLRLPFPAEIFAGFEQAETEELVRMRQGLVQVPGLFEAPEVLRSAVALLPPADAPSFEFAAACESNIQEFNKIVQRTVVANNLTRSSNAIGLAHSILKSVYEALNAALEDSPIIGSKPAIGVAIVAGILEATSKALSFAADEIANQIRASELCRADCLVDIPSAKLLRGKGCDNRNNDCGPLWYYDELDEDQFAPEIFVDSALVGKCYRTTLEAQAAADLAVRVVDDCAPITPSVLLSAAPSPTSCAGQLTITAQDVNNNAVNQSLAVTIDSFPPAITLAALDACYPTLAAARTAVTASAIQDCTAVRSTVSVAEKDCLADLAIEAIDECGNRSAAVTSVRVDGTPPEVDVERLLIPSFRGLSCFPSIAAATATVAEATNIADDCSAAGALTTQVTTSGTACNLGVTVTATDQCALTASDSIVVRVDTQPPTVSCAVATPALLPVDYSMRDVGLSISVADTCDPAPRIEVEVTSDEPTATANYAEEGPDPTPDAQILRDASGAITGLRLRAQRIGLGVDGRVYRIRVVATDACGLSSNADCFVGVPSSSNSPPAINSGQRFVATENN